MTALMGSVVGYRALRPPGYLIARLTRLDFFLRESTGVKAYGWEHTPVSSQLGKKTSATNAVLALLVGERNFRS